MPGFLITTVGLAAYTAAGGMGPLVDITRFRVGPDSTAEGYTPSIGDLDIPTPFTSGSGLPALGYLPIVNYQVISASEVAYTLRMDQSIGTFDFGSIALYQEEPPGTYVCVAVYAFSSRIKKQILTMIDAGNVIEITATLSLTNISTLSISILPVSVTMANIQEANSPDVLPIPSVAPVNAYIVNGSGSPYGLDTDGNSILAYKNDTNYWTFSTHLHEIYTTGLVDSSTTTQLTDLSLNNTLVSGFALGMYIIVFTNNGYDGVSRMVTAVGTDTLDWFSPMTAPPAGTTYKVYIANVNWGGSSSGAGGNVFASVTATASQTVFNTFPVQSDQAIMFFGAAFQPPTSYLNSGPFEVTLSPDPGLPAGTKVNFIARTLDYSTVIPGGTAGQALIKNSATDGDYTWTNVSLYSGSITGSGLTINSPRLAGRTTGGSGAIEEISVGTGALLFASGLLRVKDDPTLPGVKGFSLPGGTTAQRDDALVYYGMRYNTSFEVYEGFSAVNGVATPAYAQFDGFQRTLAHPRVSYWTDEFLGRITDGAPAALSYGELSWSATASSGGYISRIGVPEASLSKVNHPGIIRIQCDNSQFTALHLGNDTTQYQREQFTRINTRYFRWVVAVNNIVDVAYACGLGDGGGTNNVLGDRLGDNGIAFIFDPTDHAKWRFVVMDGAGAPYFGIGVDGSSPDVVAFNWYVLEARIEYAPSGGDNYDVFFRVNGGSWVTIAIPGTTDGNFIQPICRVREKGGLGTRSLYVDQFSMYTQEMGQRYT